MADQKKAGLPEDNCTIPAVFLIEYNDGLKASVVMLPKHCDDFCFAAQVKGQPQPVSTQFWLQEPEFGHFSYLSHNIESMYLTGQATYPVERTLLTTGILDAAMTSRHQNQARIETPEMARLTYRPSNAAIRRAMFPS